MFSYPIGQNTKNTIKSFLLEKANDPIEDEMTDEEGMTEEEKERKRKEEEDQEKINSSPFKIQNPEEKPDYTKEFRERLKNLGVHVTDDLSGPPAKTKEEMVKASEKIAVGLGVGGHKKSSKRVGGFGFGVGVHPSVKDVAPKTNLAVGGFDPNVLLGPAADIVGKNFSSLVMQPYKELQYIKLQKSIIPGFALKAQGFADVVNAGKNIAASVGPEGEKQNVQMGAQRSYKEQRIKQTIVDPATLGGDVEKIKERLIAIGGDKEMLKKLDNDTLKQFYSDTYTMLNQTGKGPSSDASKLDQNIQKATKDLTGMGGLDPYFAQELSAKLRGGEWVETMTKELGPSQERGVMSSMGHRRSAVSGF
jgi:hypothetical protein